MSGCCGEAGCSRARPFLLYLGDLSGRVLLATRYRQTRGERVEVSEKHDVTAAVRRFIASNPDFTRAVLEDAGR